MTERLFEAFFEERDYTFIRLKKTIILNMNSIFEVFCWKSSEIMILY